MENFEKNNDTIINRNQILSDIESLDICKCTKHESILKEDSIENMNIENKSTVENMDIENKSAIEEHSISTSDNESEKIDTETASTTNCLALTIKEEHKLVAVKNVCLHSLKVTWKVIASTIALHILKIFF